MTRIQPQPQVCPSDPGVFISVYEVATLARCRDAAVRIAIRAGQLRAATLGARLLVSLADAEAWASRRIAVKAAL